ncbi:hypothetical protein [Aggregatilinea lenta]|uniref:hypothetical protein n=1 Tax=Aggregatilinea lenta TaxID=913108 RepID=UPI000E5ABF9D|nr:hypothetical protein [Aggregatilinea lenta]
MNMYFDTVEGRAQWFANLRTVAQKARSDVSEAMGIGESQEGLWGGELAERIMANLEPYLFGTHLNLLEVINAIIDMGHYSDSDVCNTLALAGKSPTFAVLYALLIGHELPDVVEFMRGTKLHII